MPEAAPHNPPSAQALLARFLEAPRKLARAAVPPLPDKAEAFLGTPCNLCPDFVTFLQYELQGDYYVIAGEDERPAVGIWGQRHLRWLKQNRRFTYTNLLTSGKLYDYLRKIDAQASGQPDALITY